VFTENPKPKELFSRGTAMTYPLRKAEDLESLKESRKALKTYAVAVSCGHLAMLAAKREEDKLNITAEAHQIHIRAAYLHFLKGKHGHY